jgi:Tol biopolymer transport system component
MLTASGVKLLDFGLARAFEDSSESSDLTAAPTMGRDLTAEGSIVGTVPYMAPEQLEGRRADARTDVFALGSVLYEMVTGRKAFSGASQASLISAILTTDPPPPSASQPMSPPAFDRLVKTCLAKDPADRWQSAHDVELQLRGIREALSSASSDAAAAVARRRGMPSWLPWAITAVAAAGALAGWLRRPAADRVRERIEFPLPPPPATEHAAPAEGIQLQFSPDGRTLAFVANDQSGPFRLWLRSLSSDKARPLEGTEQAGSLFWSPDGGSIAFFASGKLARVSAAGGPATTICDLPGRIGRAGTWGAEGQILFADVQGSAIYRVSAEGGTPQPVLRSDPEHGLYRVIWPHFLPDGKSFLYVAWRRGHDDALMLSRPGEPPREVMPVRSRVQFVEPGYLVFVRDGVLLAQRFDVASGRTAGSVFPLAPRVDYFLSTGWADFDARPNVLAYRVSARLGRLKWYDHAGREISAFGETGGYRDVAISPDDKRALFSRERPDIRTYDLWTYDFARGVETAVTDGLDSEFAGLWLPDGKSIVYSAVEGLAPQIVLRQFGQVEERRLRPTTGYQEASSISPDGATLAFNEREGGGTFEAWLLPLRRGSPDGAPPAAVKFSPVGPRPVFVHFSPDGRTVAFLLTESGRPEVYVAPLGAPGERVRLSTNGASRLQFSRDGKELYFISYDSRMMVVPIRSSPALEPGEPRPLFPIGSAQWTSFDVTSDGRFLASVDEAESGSQPATVVVNWLPQTPPR